MAVVHETSAVKASMRMSRRRRVEAAAASARQTRRDSCTPEPKQQAEAPPSADSSNASTRSCRTSRRRPAPSATRSDISRARTAARANRRFATFAQAIRRTSPTTAIST